MGAAAPLASAIFLNPSCILSLSFSVVDNFRFSLLDMDRNDLGSVADASSGASMGFAAVASAEACPVVLRPKHMG